jgi:hypothetical protein
LDEELRHIERRLRSDRKRVDAPAWHALPLRSSPIPAAPRPAAAATSWTTSLRGALAWLLICAGLAATVCGLVLLAWWWFDGRADLLIPALASAAAGQFGLLGGLLIHPPALASSHSAARAAESDQSDHWLDLHRRLDDILRADLPPARGKSDAPLPP